MQEQSRQGLLFSFIQEINEGQPSKQIVMNTIKIIYILLLFFIFLVISDPENVLIINFIKWPYISLVLASLTAFLISEILVAIFYHVHMQLMYQISIFRYIIFPIFLLVLAHQINTPNVIPFWASILSYLLLTLFCIALIFITFNQFSQKQLRVGKSRFQVLLAISDSLMMVVIPLNDKDHYPILLVIWLGLQFVVIYNQKLILMQKISKILKLMHYEKQFFLYIFFLTTILFPKIDNTSVKMAIFIASLPIILIITLFNFCQIKNVKIDEKIFKVEAPFSSFSSIVYKLSEELILYKTNLNKKFEQSFMLTFISAHLDKCEDSNCLLSQKSTIEELKNCNQASNRRTIFYKVIKKLQFLFELYEERYPNDLQLKILLLQFYSAHLPNKLKLRQTIQKIKKQALGFQEKLLIHRLTKRMKQIQVVQFVDFTKPEDEYQNIKKIILENLTYLKEFWNVLLEEKVDINKLINISAKLFHLKCQLQLMWKKHLNEIKFVSWKIIKVYAIYRRLILHDSTKACILEDYCKIVQQRIKNKFELAYMSVQTQKGLIAISLSESSLGNILTVNNQTVKLFNFSNKKEMIDLRVNDIMPIVYSIVHDGILASFLKNRYKRINQDQRLLFAKNKNGFIFPFLLQLNKMSWNTNDQLIFISNVQLRKSKKAPIYCITDLEGYIQDRTSTYYWLFNNNKKQKEKGSVQNIQQLIPNFFEIVQEDLLAKPNKKYEFQERVMIKKTSGQIQIAFSAVCVYIKNQKVGYLIEGNTIAPMFTLSQKKPLKQILQQKGYTFYKNEFNLKHLQYQIRNLDEQKSRTSLKGDELSIPYIKTADFNNLFRKQLFQNKDYGHNIKTLRLKNNKLQLAIQQQSFQSFEMDSQAKQMSVMKRIQQMKEELNVQQNKDLSNYYRIIAIVTCMLIIGLSSVVIGNTLAFESQQIQQNDDIVKKSLIRQLLPQYLIYLHFPIQMQDFQSVKQSIRTELINAILSSSVQERKKEDIMKSIYYAQINETLYFQQQMLDFTSNDTNFNNNIFNLLYSFLSCAAVYVLVLFLMFVFFKLTMNHIYSIFLSISDKKLQLILLQSTKLHQYLSDKIVQQDIFQVFHEQVTQNSDQQFERVKKTKTQFSSQDWKMLCQLVLPMLIVLGFGIFTSVFMAVALKNHSRTFQIWKKTQQLFPQTSVVMLQSLMNEMKATNLSLANKFDSLMQLYESQILVQQLDFSQQLISLKGDPCKDNFFLTLQSNISAFCSSAQSFENSLSNQLNFIYMYLTDKQAKTDTQWSFIIKLEYNLVKPLLDNASEIVRGVMEKQRNFIKQTSFIIIIILMLLMVIATLYISCYPIRTISQQLLFTKDLISIIPADRDIMPIQALATLITEAIEFKQYK